jgi:hypothetical protein
MELISDEYLRQQHELHSNPNYGVASQSYAPLVADIIRKYQISSVADYGAGKCRLASSLQQLGLALSSYFPYDPAFPEYGQPRSADLLCCIDVLEHIEPEFLGNVIDQIGELATKYAFITVHTGSAVKILPDGRNAHLIQAPSSWWLSRLVPKFEIIQLQQTHGGFWILASPKDYSISINSK